MLIHRIVPRQTSNEVTNNKQKQMSFRGIDNDILLYDARAVDGMSNHLGPRQNIGEQDYTLCTTSSVRTIEE